ncbi:MAG: selenocysteine-specific translation elongation factor, partial [Chloroflexota bacterium]
MFTVGTAGHVDHGKSTLVKALTGIDPDRLPEEKEREMTIDLGFAWLKLPDGREVSIVDVPGHERFIKNMLAGVGGIDLALLVVAADEGVMPQTREHLAILDLLRVRHGIAVVTKRDLVEPDWLELVVQEVGEKLAGTSLAGAAVIPVSATTREGLPDLLAQMAALLDRAPERPDRGRPRLPVDRVFTLTGFGTVVTGTLIDGAFELGDEVEILPQRRHSRIRGLQTHRHKVERAEPGSRTAINLAGVALEDVHRGDVVARAGQIVPTRTVDVRLRLIPDALRGIRNNEQISLFTGASESLGWASLLEGKGLSPGDEGWVRLRLAEPLAVAKGDAFILRLPSPGATIGGGEIADVSPRLHHRFRGQSLAWLTSLAEGSPDRILLGTLSAGQPVEARLALDRSGLAADQARASLSRLLESGGVVELDNHLISRAGWEALGTRVQRDLGDHHRRFPLRPGMSKEELKSRLGLPARLFGAALQHWLKEGEVTDGGSTVARASFEVQIPEELRARLDRAMELMREKPYAPPAETELGLSAEEVGLLTIQRKLTRVSDAVVFDRQAYDGMLAGTVEHL